MVNVNEKADRERLHKALSTDAGKYIIQYLQQEIEKVGFDKIDRKQTNEIVGEEFKVAAQVREKLGKILSFFDSIINN